MTREILVVDDEPSIALSLEFLMEQAGYRVRTASGVSHPKQHAHTAVCGHNSSISA